MPSQPDLPPPDHDLEEWCQSFCPTLPLRVESVVREWHLDAKSTAEVRDILLNHVRQSVLTT